MFIPISGKTKVHRQTPPHDAGSGPAPAHGFNKKDIAIYQPGNDCRKYNTAPDQSTENSRTEKLLERNTFLKKVKLSGRRILFLLCGLLCRCLLYRLLCRRFLCCCHEFSTSYRKGLYFFSICQLINILVATPFSRIELIQTTSYLAVK